MSETHETYRRLLSEFNDLKAEAERIENRCNAITREMSDLVKSNQAEMAGLAKFSIGETVYRRSLFGGFGPVGTIERIEFDYNFGRPSFSYSVRTPMGLDHIPASPYDLTQRLYSKSDVTGMAKSEAARLLAFAES